MPQSAFINPITLPKDLNEAEQDFVDRMAAGKECIRDCQKSNTIRADLIRFFAWGGDETYRIRGNIIYLQGALIPDALDLAHIPSHYSLVLTDCYFAAQIRTVHSAFHFLNLQGSVLEGGLEGDGMKIKSDLLMHGGFLSKREVQLRGAEIGGQVICDGGKFKAGEGQDYSLNAMGIKVGGDFTMCNGFFAKGEVRLIGADIGKKLHCDGGRFVKTKGDALCADGIKVSGNLFMQKIFAEGGVWMRGAIIGDDWYCNHAFIKNEKGSALVADGAKVGGSLFMQNIFVKGEVRLPSVHIGGNIACDSRIFNDANEKTNCTYGTKVALTAQGIKMGGSLLLTSGFQAKGIVLLHNAEIGGNVFCEGVFINENNDALVLNGAKIGGDLSMKKICTRGKVQLITTDIGRNWSCEECQFYGDVIAGSARIGHSLFWAVAGGKGKYNLRYATANVFDYNENSLHGFEFILDGFSYKRFAEQKSVESRLNWLNSQKPFSPQPFEHAAKVLFEMGQGKDARRVLFEAEKAATEETAPTDWRSSLSYLWRGFLEKATGYNYLFRKMVITSIIIIGCNIPVFGIAERCGYIVPHQPVVLANKKYKKFARSEEARMDDICRAKRPTDVTGEIFPDYPPFNAVLFSLDVFIPTSPLHQEAYWHPQLNADGHIFWRFFLTIGYVVGVIAGWLLVSLITLTYTGILQRRQTGGTGDK